MKLIQRIKNREKGFVMLAIIFLIAIAGAAAYAKTLFNVTSQEKTIQREIQSRQLGFVTLSALDYLQKWLKDNVTLYGLQDPMFYDNSSGGNNAGNIQELQGNPNGPMALWLNSFKTNFHNFAPSNDYAISRVIFDALQFDQACTTECFARVNTNSVANAYADFTLKVKTQAGTDMTATRSMRQAIRISASNLGDFSVFVQDMVLNPGPDMTLEGPVYVGGNAYITPSRNHTITFTVNPAIRNPSVLQAHGIIYWFGQRTSGDPAEFDVYGAPVLYYYMSNISFGWEDIDHSGTLEPNEKSTIKVLDNRNFGPGPVPNPPSYTELIGNSHHAPVLSYSSTPFIDSDSRNIFKSDRLKTDIWDWPVFTTTHFDFGMQGQPADIKVKSTAIFAPSALATNFIPSPYPGEAAWRTFLDANFLITPSVGQPYRLFTDHADAQTLIIGSASNPHALIDLALPPCGGPNQPACTPCGGPNQPVCTEDDYSLQQVKLQWLARDPGPNARGLSFHFGLYKCNDPSRTPQCVPLRQRNPEDIDPEPFVEYGVGPYSNDPTKFIYLPSLTTVASGSMTADYDARRDPQRPLALTEIVIDVHKLGLLIASGAFAATGDPSNPNLNHPHPHRPRDADYPVIFYIGIPTETFSVAQGQNVESYGVMSSVVRLSEANKLPKKGLTVATNGFLQTLGNYNNVCPVGAACAADPADPGYCEMNPAAILADQIEILSGAYQSYPINTRPDPSAPSPSQFTNPIDGLNYLSPVDSSVPPHTFSISDYRAHPIYSQNPNDADVTVKSMLISGNVPNQLRPIFENNPNVNRKFYSDWITGIQSYQPDPQGSVNSVQVVNQASRLDQDPHAGAYLKKTEFQRFLCNHPNVNDDPVDCPNRTGINPNFHDPAYEDIPVYIITGYIDNAQGTDQPQYQPVGTIRTIFGPNSDIPLYLKVDENGIIQSGPPGQYLEPSDLEYSCKRVNDNDQNRTQAYRMKPGTRYAALSQMNPFLTPPLPQDPAQPGYDPANRGLSKGINLFKQSENCYARYVCCHSGNTCDPYTPNDCTQFNACGSGNELTCVHGCTGTDCGVNYSCTGSGGEGQCSDAPAHCINQVPGDSQAPNGYEQWRQPHCNDSCPAVCGNWQCRGGTPPTLYPFERKLVYNIGGYPRVYYSSYRPNTSWQEWKREFLYIQNSVPAYSGGLENFLRFRENWNKAACHFSNNLISCTEIPTQQINFNHYGALDILWTAQTLKLSDGQTPAYWSSASYAAPERTFHYLVTLQKPQCTPAGIPGTASVEKRGFSEEH